MKILMIDHCGIQVETRKMFIKEAVECTIESVSTSDEVRSIVHAGSHDIIILDHATETCLQCAEYILSLDPLQKILVVSDAPHCIIARCEDCVDNHNARRLSNPTSINNIIRMVQGFENNHCDHFHVSK